MKVIDLTTVLEHPLRKQGNAIKLSAEQVLDTLYKNLKPVCTMPHDRVLDSSKYVRLARDYNYRNYKFCTWNNIIELGLDTSLLAYQKQFFQKCGATLAIFNELNGKLVSVVFRSIQNKDFMDFSLVYNIYGYDMIDPEFRYGDYLLITEGIYDADSIRPIFKNSVAMLTSNITLLQAGILKSMTDKFIIAFDNDNAGNKGFEVALKRLGTEIKKLKIYEDDKDLGTLEEIKHINHLEYDTRVKYYKEELVGCETEMGFSL